MGAAPPFHETTTAGDAGGRPIRLLSWNIQAATATARYHHYVTHGWKQFLPHAERVRVLDSIATLVADYDIAGLQEVDAGSLRSGFINQTKYLAERAGFPVWHHQLNRRVGKIARASNGLLSRLPVAAVNEHRLPGTFPGRGALWVRYAAADTRDWVLVVAHLALGRRARESQLAEIAERLADWPRAIVMGDFNTPLEAAEIRHFLSRTGLDRPGEAPLTFPSWRPQRALDHIFVTRGLEVESYGVVDTTLSDHRPVAMTLRVPVGERMKEQGAR